jgi:hypothetical protein
MTGHPCVLATATGRSVGAACPPLLVSRGDRVMLDLHGRIDGVVCTAGQNIVADGGLTRSN